MKATRLVRERMLVGLGLGTVLVACGVVAVAGVGCGSSNNGGSGGTPDGSMESSTPDANGDVSPTPGSDAMTDAGSDAAHEAGPPAPKVFVVQASEDLPPVRYCFGIGTPSKAGFQIFSFVPLPDSLIGVPPGTGGLLPVPGGADISKLTLTVYAVSSEAVALETAAGADAGTELTCDQLIPIAGGPDASTYLPSNAYFQIQTPLTMGGVSDGNTYVIALTGCAPGEDPDGSVAPKCGAGYSSATGNLSLTPFKVDSVTMPDASTMGAQFAQASTAWDYAATTVGGATYAGLQLAPDASPTAGLITNPVSPPMFGSQPGPMKLFSGVAFDGTTTFYAAIVNIGDAGPQAVFQTGGSLPEIQQITYPLGVPEAGVLRNGEGFVFVLVGDPMTNPYVTEDGGPSLTPVDGGQFNLEYAHVLAFPTSNP
jgi:hypothetical protein